MCAVEAQITAPPHRGKEGLQGKDVGAGSVEDREGLDARAELLLQDLLQPCRVDVLAVGHLVPAVGGCQC